jgi:formylglycine-generating enzyme required for sulfatase activity
VGVSVFGERRKRESDTAYLGITTSWENRNADKPVLHVMLMSIEKYQHAGRGGIGNLRFTTADADALGELFTEQKRGNLYRDVQIHQYTDSDITKEGFQKAFADLAGTVRREDNFVFFFAGHGFVDKGSGDFFFIPWDSVGFFDNPMERNIVMDDLVSGITSVHAANSLVLLDTCQSGTLLESGDTAFEKLIRQLGQKAILTATMGNQDAIESVSLGHGIFTMSLMDSYEHRLENRYSTVADIIAFTRTDVPDKFTALMEAARRGINVVEITLPETQKPMAHMPAGNFEVFDRYTEPRVVEIRSITAGKLSIFGVPEESVEIAANGSVKKRLSEGTYQLTMEYENGQLETREVTVRNDPKNLNKLGPLDTEGRLVQFNRVFATFIRNQITATAALPAYDYKANAERLYKRGIESPEYKKFTRALQEMAHYEKTTYADRTLYLIYGAHRNPQHIRNMAKVFDEQNVAENARQWLFLLDGYYNESVADYSSYAEIEYAAQSARAWQIPALNIMPAYNDPAAAEGLFTSKPGSEKGMFFLVMFGMQLGEIKYTEGVGYDESKIRSELNRYIQLCRSRNIPFNMGKLNALFPIDNEKYEKTADECWDILEEERQKIARKNLQNALARYPNATNILVYSGNDHINMYKTTAAARPPERPVGPDMVRINGGTFTMGSPVDENKYDTQHTVTVKSFYIGRTEVTQKDYKDVMGTNPSLFEGDNLPVEMVSWYDAIEYCNKRSQKEGLTPAYIINKNQTDPNNKNEDDTVKWTVTWNRNASGYRLPTEAEWEYACRAGTTTTYNTGSEVTNNIGWYRANSDVKTHPVGQKTANAWGLYDMHGNVWEWCWDWHGNYSGGPQTDPTGAVSGYSRVDRGGSWFFTPDFARSGSRGTEAPHYHGHNNGFRVARN